MYYSDPFLTSPLSIWQADRTVRFWGTSWGSSRQLRKMWRKLCKCHFGKRFMIYYHLENAEPCIYSIKHYGIFPRFLRRLQEVSKETVRFFKSEGMEMAANLKSRVRYLQKHLTPLCSQNCARYARSTQHHTCIQS